MYLALFYQYYNNFTKNANVIFFYVFSFLVDTLCIVYSYAAQYTTFLINTVKSCGLDL